MPFELPNTVDEQQDLPDKIDHVAPQNGSWLSEDEEDIKDDEQIAKLLQLENE